MLGGRRKIDEHQMPEELVADPAEKPPSDRILACNSLSITLPLLGAGGLVFAYHYLAYSHRGMFTYRHDSVQHVLVEMLRKVSDPASVKKTHIYHWSYSPHWRPGITVLNYNGRRRRIIINVRGGRLAVCYIVREAGKQCATIQLVRRRYKKYACTAMSSRTSWCRLRGGAGKAVLGGVRQEQGS
ncbi:hypothetical protein CYMTET_52083 [Cymbomonas tetramitiformis]|uniref:Uncharacterized protein n=1 Tax=Cymbomonas tetramitiformis TaxID=36881 RepID=A0AAE0BLE4_9CHLO|nr:hypothetical protein CYMTET_52083 [Cymbomonas tetramitiformis]